MAGIGFFFSVKASVGGLFFDGKMDEGHNYSVTPTELPVEFGANITDEIIVNQDRCEMTVMVGDVVGLFDLIQGYNPTGRAADALFRLRQLMTTRQPIVVVTNLVRYPAMILTNIDVTQDKTNSSTLVAHLSFKQINIIDQQGGSINNGNQVNNNDPQYQPPQNSGQKQMGGFP